MLERQEHPFSPYIPSDAIALVIGTAPPWRLCQNDNSALHEGEIPFFYGSIHNLFWYVIKAVLEPENPRWPRTKAQCENLLKRHRLGIGDILQSFVRQDQKAADDHLSDFSYNERLLTRIYFSHNEIKYLYFTGHFAGKLYLKALKMHGFIYRIPNEDKSKKCFTLNVQTADAIKSHTCQILSSPSPRINRSLEEMIDEYRKCFAPVIKATDELVKHT